MFMGIAIRLNIRFCSPYVFENLRLESPTIILSWKDAPKVPWSELPTQSKANFKVRLHAE